MSDKFEAFGQAIFEATNQLVGTSDDPNMLDNERMDEVVKASNDYLKRVNDILSRK